MRGLTAPDDHDVRSNLANLIAQEHDPLIPYQRTISVLWSQARTTWQQYLSTSSTLPDGAFDLLCLLANVPAIPKTILHELCGRAVWSVPRPGGGSMSVSVGEMYLMNH